MLFRKSPSLITVLRWCFWLVPWFAWCFGWLVIADEVADAFELSTLDHWAIAAAGLVTPILVYAHYRLIKKLL
jgi:hypothetical protein